MSRSRNTGKRPKPLGRLSAFAYPGERSAKFARRLANRADRQAAKREVRLADADSRAGAAPRPHLEYVCIDPEVLDYLAGHP